MSCIGLGVIAVFEQLAATGEERPGARPTGAAGFTVRQVWFFFSILMEGKLLMDPR
jgi:hypothetical protein